MSSAIRVWPAARAAAGVTFPVALFASAALIFLLQPMFARMTTPLLGGSPAVWNTAMVFFQAALLLGYAYAHALQRIASVRIQAAVHLGGLALAAVALPVWPTTALGGPDVDMPALWLLGVLTLSVGAPYAIASATAPLLQAWYAQSGRPDAHDPYYLYAASNLGSMLGLLTYPFALEPLLGLQAQSVAWSIGYGVVAALIAACAMTIAQSPAAVTAARVEPRTAADWRARAYWMAAAAVPSSLLLGATQHIVTDVASAPFLWVPPLVLYLLTFVIAFRKGAGAPGFWLLLAHAMLLAVLIAGARLPLWFEVAKHLAVLFVGALVCHAALASRRPPAAQLTEFYMYVSLGGVLGGAATALAAPVLFDSVWEYPLALAATALFRPKGDPALATVSRALAAAAVLALALAALGVVTLTLFVLSVAALAAFANRERPALFAALVFATLAAQIHTSATGAEILRERTFFGVMRVADVETPSGVVRLLTHGTTVHGAQFVDPARAREPLTYYHPGTALNEAVRLGLPKDRPADVALLGLGTGAMACGLRDGDRATFYEIDPAVARIAADPRYFTYLAACPHPGETVLGDARIKLAKEPDASFDVVLVDAFSSDAIPAHLLTREAVRLYVQKLRPDGALVLHVSNRNLAIVNEGLRVAAAEGLAARARTSPLVYKEEGRQYEGSAAVAIIVARDEARLSALGLPDTWKNPAPPPGDAWSDDRIDLLRPVLETPVPTR